eukprot:15072026-Alexandrium_andersonii.AAC.1
MPTCGPGSGMRMMHATPRWQCTKSRPTSQPVVTTTSRMLQRPGAMFLPIAMRAWGRQSTKHARLM